MLPKLGKIISIAAAAMLCLTASLTAVSAEQLITATAPETATAPAATPEARIIRFDTTPNMIKNKNALGVISDGVTQGKYKIITKDDPDAPYIKLLYEGKVTKYNAYRCIPQFSEANYITSDFKFVRVTYRSTDAVAASLIFRQSSNLPKIVPNTKLSNGEWVISAPVELPEGVIGGFVGKGNIMLEYTAEHEDADMCIKEIAFFKSVEDAYAYYGEEVPPPPEKPAYSAITFGAAGNAGILSEANYGKYEIDQVEEAVKIVYTETTNFQNVHYMAKIRFEDPSDYYTDFTYMRILYSAKHPDGVTTAEFNMKNDAGGAPLSISKDLKDTNGEYVMTETFLLPSSFPARFAKGGHFSFYTTTAVDGGEYSIKGIFLFPTKEAADNFVYVKETRPVTIAGNDISKYKIVIPENSSSYVYDAASSISKYVSTVSGHTLHIVTDDVDESKYEILVGPTNRKASGIYLNELMADGASYAVYCGDLVDEKIVLNAYVPAACEVAAEKFLMSFLYMGMPDVPDEIKVEGKVRFYGNAVKYSPYEAYNTPYTVNVSDPIVFTEDFTDDEGYFTEENGAKLWKYQNGALTYGGSDYSVAYVHVYEPNVSVTATVSYTSAAKKGSMGLIARYVSPDGYVKAGYDFRTGEWYVDFREGIDLSLIRAGSAAATVAPNTEYVLNLTLNGKKAVFTVNGAVVVECEVEHITPGRFGVYSDGVSVSADNFEAVLMSGEGTIFKDVVHHVLPDEMFREGGSVVIMDNNVWKYQNHRNAAFQSIDNGATWQRTDLWVNNYGYMNVFRLNNGQLIQAGTKSVGGVDYVVARLSSNDSKTWIEGGVICPVIHPEMGVGGGNMNDKFSQSGTTNRIFYGLNYDNRGNDFTKKVFCEYYYSDDNGLTWNRSETGSHEIEGAKDEKFFGENKLLQCADGTVRAYCSWNILGNIMYAESTDGGVTFGPFKELEGFKSSHSSMQFVRDPYGPTDTTYYMLWCYDDGVDQNGLPKRSRLSLAYSTDGQNWDYIGDIWRWECRWRGGSNSIAISHIVDPFINVTEDYIVCGTGLSEKFGSDYHNEQRQHIWSIPKASLPAARTINKFTDVPLGTSYYSAINFVTEKGLFNGTSETTFSPSTTMTRSMFVTVLGRLDGADMSAYTTPTFKDVVAGQWYTSYVEWAAANNVVNGIGNGLYGVNGEVTVEQICLMLSRYNGSKSAATASGKTVADFTDGASVSSWAADGVKWAVENGVYAGQGGKLNPTAPASRALVATMFHNYVTVYGE